MALNPALAKIVAAASAKYRTVEPLARPNTFIADDRFHALIERLKNITETDDEARDKAITEALLDVGGVAPESWRAIYKNIAP